MRVSEGASACERVRVSEGASAIWARHSIILCPGTQYSTVALPSRKPLHLFESPCPRRVVACPPTVLTHTAKPVTRSSTTLRTPEKHTPLRGGGVRGWSEGGGVTEWVRRRVRSEPHRIALFPPSPVSPSLPPPWRCGGKGGSARRPGSGHRPSTPRPTRTTAGEVL